MCYLYEKVIERLADVCNLDPLALKKSKGDIDLSKYYSELQDETALDSLYRNGIIYCVIKEIIGYQNAKFHRASLRLAYFEDYLDKMIQSKTSDEIGSLHFIPELINISFAYNHRLAPELQLLAVKLQEYARLISENGDRKIEASINLIKDYVRSI